MAIKVSGTTVIDNGPAIYANGVTGTSGQVLTSTGVGITWADAAGADKGIFYLNNNTVTSNYTISSTKNALSAGPITINSGTVVTINNGASWSII